jgi:UDP-N-acetylmuramoyl-L-alanyl-D-glutamate--2,6-diaminopimelate ligase
MEAYFAAKAGLFDRVLPEDGTAVINLDDPKGPTLPHRGRGARVSGT